MGDNAAPSRFSLARRLDVSPLVLSVVANPSIPSILAVTSRIASTNPWAHYGVHFSIQRAHTR